MANVEKDTDQESPIWGQLGRNDITLNILQNKMDGLEERLSSISSLNVPELNVEDKEDRSPMEKELCQQAIRMDKLVRQVDRILDSLQI